VQKTVLSDPKAVRTEKLASLVSVGYQHAFCVTKDNKVWSWVPQTLAEAEHRHFVEPIEVQGLPLNSQIVDIKSGSFQTIILTGNHQVFRIEHPLPTDAGITQETMMPFTV
jgi:alpha-tubulin suppressor-like RCC1 family protein